MKKKSLGPLGNTLAAPSIIRLQISKHPNSNQLESSHPSGLGRALPLPVCPDEISPFALRSSYRNCFSGGPSVTAGYASILT